MTTQEWIVYYSLLAILSFYAVHGANKTDYYDLYDYIIDPDYYNKNVRPAQNETSKMEIYMEFYLLSLVDVDEKQQTLISSARLGLYWDDDILSWWPSDFGGINTTLVPQTVVYLPDIVVANSVTAQTQLGYNQLQVRLRSDGTVDWEPTLLLSTSCDIDITYFPFDSQVCYIQFENAVTYSTEIAIHIDSRSNAVNLDDFTENGQWELVETAGESLPDVLQKSKIQFGFLLKRRRTFYVMNIIMPIFFLSLTASLVFALPADEGEKMGTGITVLLAFAVYLTIVSDLVPNTSLQVSLLGLYLTILLGMSAVSIVVCVAILRMHFRNSELHAVGSRMAMATRFFRKWMCLDKRESALNQVTPIISYMDPEGRENTTTEQQSRKASRRPSDSQSSSQQEMEPLTWQTVATTLDLFCFFLFSLLTVVITATFMLALAIGGIVNTPSL